MMTVQCQAATEEILPATFITDTKTIDAVYATAGVEVVHVALLPKYGDIGDHRCFLLNFCSASVTRDAHPRVIPGTPMKLNCNCARI